MSNDTPSMPLSTPDAIRRRRSVRHFLPDPIADDLLDELVSLTVKAPSSWNLQPWRIVVVRDPERRERLAKACYNQPQVREAPATFVFAFTHSGWRGQFDDVVRIAQEKGAWSDGFVETMRRVAPGFQEALGDRLREYNVKDSLIAATHLALAAQSLGLGSSFMNGFVEEKVKDVIGAGGDDDIGVALVMSIGRVSDPGLDPGRLPLERTVFADDLANPWTGTFHA